MSTVRTGLENLIADPPKWLQACRIGLLCNPASVDRQFNHARILINRLFPGQLKALYSPQHGFFAEKQDNMVESEDTIDPVLKIPVFSLYGQTRIPTRKMLDPIDVLIVDLQDVGTRVYTFIYTVSHCLEAAKRYKKKVLILDRPNPINGVAVEGNCLHPDCASFVGRYPIPMRHGLTIGELSQLFNSQFDIGSEIEIIPMRGWKRSMRFADTGLPWVAPSPNLPTPTSAHVYPGQVLWEGTNISEGRGTTQPFEIFGAPFFEVEKLLETSEFGDIPGAILRPVIFEPTSNKWQGISCHGFQIHVTDIHAYRPYMTSLGFLQQAMLQYKQHFEWKAPPYEYEYQRLPIDLIIGDSSVRQHLEKNTPLDQIEASWQGDLERFTEIGTNFHLYT
jgi:uncharacterized protein YbbC (DUF1343 family)